MHSTQTIKASYPDYVKIFQNSIRRINPIKLAECLHRHFTNEDTWILSTHVQICSLSVTDGERLLKAAVTCDLLRCLEVKTRSEPAAAEHAMLL